MAWRGSVPVDRSLSPVTPDHTIRDQLRRLRSVPWFPGFRIPHLEGQGCPNCPFKKPHVLSRSTGLPSSVSDRIRRVHSGFPSSSHAMSPTTKSCGALVAMSLPIPVRPHSFVLVHHVQEAIDDRILSAAGFEPD